MIMTETPVSDFQLPAPPPLPDGFGVRPAARADVATLVALLRAEEVAASGESSVTESEVTAWFDTRRARERISMLAVEHEGSLIGLWRVTRVFDDKYSFAVVVDRSLPSDVVDELWRAGLGWAESAALIIAEANGVSQPRADLWVFEHDALTRRHAEAAGFEQARAFIEMQLDLPVYRAPTGPADVRVRQAQVDGADSADLALMYELITESFRDHFDFTERTLDDWTDNRLQDPLGTFDHWYLAELDGVAVGGLIGHDAFLESDNAGYVANLGVLREGRGRGVAKALLHASFARYAADGRAAVKLHVDADSPTGATHLYESVGMYRRLVGYDYHKHLGAR